MALTKTKRRVLSISAFVFLILALALIALPTPPSQAEAGTNLIGAEFDNLTVLHIGGGTLASQLVDRLEEMRSDVLRSSDIPEAVELNPEVVIIFGGEWFEGRICDTALHDFLRLTSSRGASMVMVGGTTSKFFEALDRAGVHEIPITETGEVRNPAYFKPPLVGLRMMTVDGHTAPSLLLGCASSPDVLEESLIGLIGWLPSTTPTVLSSPDLRLVIEYKYSPLLDSNPYGRLNLIASIYKLKDDGVPDYDWYFHQLKVQSVPGTVAYGSSYRNEHTWAHHEVIGGGINRWLVDYDPTTTYGTSTVGVNLLAWSWSYSIADVVVLDQSDYSVNRVYWQHDIDRSAPVGLMTYQSEPGFVVKTKQDYASTVNAWYQLRFVRQTLFSWSGKTLTSPTLYLDTFLAGN